MSRSTATRFVFGCLAGAMLAAAPLEAGDGGWSLRLDGVWTDAYGHDQHVLTVRQIDAAASSVAESAGTLDTDAGFGYRIEGRYGRGDWGLGLDFVWFKTNQSGPDRTAAADGPAGPVQQIAFEIADRSYTSTGPEEALYYRRLEDTALAMWTVDLYGTRTLNRTEATRLELRFGLRNADFDNDYRVIVGVEDVAGTRVDASSNYDRMIGPYLGLAVEIDHGRNRIEACIGQSLQLGSVELSGRTRDYTGPSADYALPAEEITAGFDSEERLRTVQDVAIPATDLRLRWSYRLAEAVAVGLGAHVSTWWDVPVPPGVVPGENGNTSLHENTVVFFGLAAGVEVSF